MYHFKHLDPVQFPHPKTGEMIFGFVYMNPEKKVDLTKVFYGHGEYFFCPMGANEDTFFEKLWCKPAEASELPKHTQAIRERMSQRFLFKKGMCVAIRDDGSNEVYGRVVKGGATPSRLPQVSLSMKSLPISWTTKNFLTSTARSICMK
jgi:hypothetical protein